MYTNAVWCPPSFPFVVWCGVDIDVSVYIYIYIINRHIYTYLCLSLWIWVHPFAVVVWCAVSPVPPPTSPWMSCRVTHPPFGVGWCVVP